MKECEGIKMDHFIEMNKLLRQAVTLYEEDRAMAESNFRSLSAQLESVKNDFEMSENGALEAEVNKALKLVFESGRRLDAVLQTVAKLLMTQMHADSRIETARIMAGAMSGQNQQLQGPADIRALLEENAREDATDREGD